MSGPGNWSSNQTGYVLHAIYLRDLIPADQRPSLDYKPSPNDEVNSARDKTTEPNASKIVVAKVRELDDRA
jgi:hypothetical protein